jgi:hypothetical protein
MGISIANESVVAIYCTLVDAYERRAVCERRNMRATQRGEHLTRA